MDSIYTVIATAGRSALLERTIRSLAECHKPPEFEKLILVENGPKGEAESICDNLSNNLDLHYIYKSEPGKSQALNVALDAIPRGLVVFFDDDVRLHRDTLLHYAEAAKRKGEDAFFGGSLGIDYEGAPPPSWLTPYLPITIRGLEPKTFAETQATRFLGANWSAFASQLKAAGGFDEAIGVGSVTNSVGEEDDIQARLIERGLEQVYVPDAKVWHYVPEEHCTPQWTLARHRREGINQGRQYYAAHPEASIFAGYPAWMLRYWLKLKLKSVLYSYRSLQHRFDTEYDLAWHRGFMAGYRHAQQSAAEVAN